MYGLSAVFVLLVYPEAGCKMMPRSGPAISLSTVSTCSGVVDHAASHLFNSVFHGSTCPAGVLNGYMRHQRQKPMDYAA